jgi:hypothetical protein
MKMHKQVLVVVIGISLAFSGSATAQRDASKCRTAVDRYNTARNNITAFVRDYAGCVSYSHDDENCSREFALLRSAQADFESAVSDSRSTCK